MKKLYFLDEEEKNRILNLHEGATKRQYLGEQQTDRQTNINKVYCGLKNGVITAGAFKDKKWDEYVKTYKISSTEIETAKKSCPKNNNSQERQTNINKVYCGLKNGVITAGTYKGNKWDVYVKEWTVLPNEIETAKKSCPKNNNSQQYKQQIITKTSDTTKQIQALLGLDKTGNMDSALLQKINDKLNGKPQEAAKSDVATQPRPKVEPLQTSLKPAEVVQQQLTTPSPEQLTAGLQQQQKAAEAAKTPPTNKEKRQERRDLRASNKAEMQALRDKQRGNQ
jgi:hypothetical protein